MGVFEIYEKVKILGFKEFLKTEGYMYLFVIVWMSINAILFIETFFKYRGEKWDYIRLVVSDGLPIARGAAQVLNFNCALILLPVCRNLVDWARGCFEGKRSIRRLFDKNILFHKWCAYTICFFAALHILAHFYNINNLVTEKLHTGEAEKIVGNEKNAEMVAFTTWPGITGLIITIALIFMVTTAVEQIRRSYFELFWYTHHLFLVFYLALGLHGASGYIKSQTNANLVPYTGSGGTQCTVLKPFMAGSTDPTCMVPIDFDDEIDPKYQVDAGVIGTLCGADNKGKGPDGSWFCFNVGGNPSQADAGLGQDCCNCLGCDTALAAKGGPKTWMWIILPLTMYLCERIFRFWRSQTRKLKVKAIIKHNDKIPVMEVQIEKVKTKAGQYAFLHCPDVSKLEWHPFTLTSCPEDEFISFHIRLVGDWTSAFAERCGFYQDERLSVAQLPYVAIDGPFGTCSEDIYRYETGVCVCAGIGVTPFASLLKELFYRKFGPEAERNPLRLKTVYFYWICPGFDSWGWFSNLLVEFERRCIDKGDEGFLKIRVHMSRGWSKDDAEKLMLQDGEDGDMVVKDDEGRKLKAKMNFGRPNWDVEFRNFERDHEGNVGVFFCGPKILSTTLHRKCNEYTSASTRFFYNKENF